MADAWPLAESLLPGTALALVLVEHGWAQALFDAVSESGGALLGEGFLTAEAGLVVGAEVAALEQAAEVIAVAQAAEARAPPAAMASKTQAADAIAASQADDRPPTGTAPALVPRTAGHERGRAPYDSRHAANERRAPPERRKA